MANTLPPRMRTDRELFVEALALWDRPESELYGKVLDDDIDIDSLVQRFLGNPSQLPL